MRICFVTFGNISNHPTMKRATGMAQPLIGLGHAVGVVVEDTPDNRDRMAGECPDAEALWYRRGRAAADRRRKEWLAEQWEADVVWCCGLGFRNWVRPRKRSGRPFAIMDHVELVSSFGNLTPLRRLWEAGSEWLCLWRFDGHVCASRYLETVFSRRLRRLRLSRPVHYSPYAYNRAWAEGPRPRVGELKERFAGRELVVYMGAFWENYGFYEMLRAFARARAERPSAVLAMIGGGPEKEGGLRLARELGAEDDVVFPGFVPEEALTSWLGRADAFVCPLRDTEQDKARCPSKLFMYLPFRKPVVTSPIGEARELFGEDYPYYFRERDVGDLAAKLAAALRDCAARSATLPDPEAHDWEARAAAFERWRGEAGLD